MKTSDLLNKDMGSCIDWLEDNPDLEISEPLDIDKCIRYLVKNSCEISPSNTRTINLLNLYLKAHPND